MESGKAELTPEQLELAKFGSLGSKKLRQLYLKHINHNSDDTYTLDTPIPDSTISGSTVYTDNKNIDVQLNLDLNNFLKSNFNDPDKDNGTSNSLDRNSPANTSASSKNKHSPNTNTVLGKKSTNKKDIERDWSTINENEPTHTALREWKSIQLRGFVDPKRFYKNTKNKLEEIPKRFQIGKIINPSTTIDLNCVDGSNDSRVTNTTSTLKNKKKTRKKPSLITTMLKEDKGWVNKRYNEIQSEKTKGSKGWYQRQVKKRKRN